MIDPFRGSHVVRSKVNDGPSIDGIFSVSHGATPRIETQIDPEGSTTNGRLGAFESKYKLFKHLIIA